MKLIAGKKKILDLILISKSLLKNRFNSVTVAIFNTYGFIPFRLESDLFCIGFLQWAGTGSGDFLWLKEAWNLITQTLIQIPTTAMAIQVVEFSSGGTKLDMFCLRITILKGNYWILIIGLMGRCQKWGIILENKMIEKLMLSKMCS